MKKRKEKNIKSPQKNTHAKAAPERKSPGAFSSHRQSP